VGAGLKAVGEGSQGRDAAFIWQPGDGADLDSAGKARVRGDATWRYMRGGELDAQATDRLDAAKCLHEGGAACADRTFAELVETGQPTAVDEGQEFIQALALLSGDAAYEPAPRPRFHSGANLRDEALQNTDPGQQNFVADQPAASVLEQHAGSVGAAPAKCA
jgi:hypothetical protein